MTDFDVPPLDAINPPFDVDGHSHFPVFIADNTDFGPPTPTRSASTHGNSTWSTRRRRMAIEAQFVVRH